MQYNKTYIQGESKKNEPKPASFGNSVGWFIPKNMWKLF